MSLTQHTGTLSPWTGLALFAGYIAATIGIAAVLLRHRDA